MTPTLNKGEGQFMKWVIDLSPKIVDKVLRSGNLTSKVAISVESPNILRTAFPTQ